MTLDFTLKSYKRLLNTLSSQGISFFPLVQYISNPVGEFTILRHDVDAMPENSLKFAKIQADLGIKGSYYFRIVPESFDKKIIKEIYELGHEVGYHYEDVSLMAKGLRAQGSGLVAKRIKESDLAEIAIESFKGNLERLRQIVPVKTICMHGSPMSKWDSRMLWKYYNYRDFGIIGEPYFDVDFSKVLYLTDTGRRWDGDAVSVRDKTSGVGRQASGEENPAPLTPHPAPFPKFHSTYNIIKAARENKLPDQIMLTFHPQRWTDKPLPWVKELGWQNVKNVVKYFVVRVISDQ